MIKPVGINPLYFKGDKVEEKAKVEEKQPEAKPAEAPQANGNEALANYNKAAIHPSQQVKTEPLPEAEAEKK